MLELQNCEGETTITHHWSGTITTPRRWASSIPLNGHVLFWSDSRTGNFTNTMACYSHVFLFESYVLRLLPQKWPIYATWLFVDLYQGEYGWKSIYKRQRSPRIDELVYIVDEKQEQDHWRPAIITSVFQELMVRYELLVCERRRTLIVNKWERFVCLIDGELSLRINRVLPVMAPPTGLIIFIFWIVIHWAVYNLNKISN